MISSNRPGFAAAPDFFLPDRFNSGVMVVPPSKETFERMVEALSVAPSYDGGDQGFLNSLLRGLVRNAGHAPAPGRLQPGELHLPVCAWAPEPAGHACSRSEILHYMVQKPWQAQSTLDGRVPRPGGGCTATRHPEKASACEGARPTPLEDWTFDKLAALVRWSDGSLPGTEGQTPVARRGPIAHQARREVQRAQTLGI